MAFTVGSPVMPPGYATTVNATTGSFDGVDLVTQAELTTALGTYYSVGGTDVPVTDGGTGASTADAARANLCVAPPMPPQRAASGDYLLPNMVTATLGSFSINFLRFCPLTVPMALTAAKIGVEITTAGSAGALLRMGIYSPAADLGPGALLVDAGTVAGDGATGLAEITINQALSAGRYWLCLVTQVAAVTVRQIATGPGIPPPGAYDYGQVLSYRSTASSYSAGLPANAPALSSGTPPLMVLKVF